MRDILICTVGTSLINNLAAEKDPGLDGDLRKGNIKRLTLRLADVSPAERRCGAEINSIHSIIAGNRLGGRELLLFFVSDTEAGRLSGELLTELYRRSDYPDSFKKVCYEVIEGLTDEDVHKFRNTGLRNLVRLIGHAARRYGSNRLLINATGGYKAQISFAGMIGQALEIPVCYMYERFSEVILLPPQPVALDLSFWLEFNDLFHDLEEGICGQRENMVKDDRFLSLVDEVDIDGQPWLALSPTGQLFHETFRHRFGRQRELQLPKDCRLPPAKKKIRFEDENDGKHQGLKIYLKKLLLFPFVKEIFTYYYNPDLNAPKRFRVLARVPRNQIEGIFSNAGQTTKFDIITTAENPGQLMACVAELNEALARKKL